MASKLVASTALFLLFDLLLLKMVSSNYVPTPPIPFPSTLSGSYGSNPANGKCPTDTLKLEVCANLLNGLVSIGKTPCCSLIKGLVDLEAAACLCTAIKANVLGIVKLNLNVALSLILNTCGKGVPPGFQCP